MAAPDVPILNYALTLERLEHAFYRDGLAEFGEDELMNADVLSSFGQQIRMEVPEYLDTLRAHEARHAAFLNLVNGDLPYPKGVDEALEIAGGFVTSGRAERGRDGRLGAELPRTPDQAHAGTARVRDAAVSRPGTAGNRSHYLDHARLIALSWAYRRVGWYTPGRCGVRILFRSRRGDYRLGRDDNPPPAKSFTGSTSVSFGAVTPPWYRIQNRYSIPSPWRIYSIPSPWYEPSYVPSWAARARTSCAMRAPGSSSIGW
jgi:hypothetical protein